MIISASRRTDIPAFYTPWFMNRIREGFLLTRNPFNDHQIKRISLSSNDIDLFVFWTRNPHMLMRHLPELDQRGYQYYFQYTITGYPKILENNVPNANKAIRTFIELSDLIGSDKVIWRYDPILLCNLVDINEHKRLFHKIAHLLAGKTKKVVISFADLYAKTDRNLKKVERLNYTDIIQQPNILLELVHYMHQVTSSVGMEIESCAEDVNLSQAGIQHGKCIDDRLIKQVFGIQFDSQKDSGQREACGCIKSIDIGSYNTCLHGCSYCYATYNQLTVQKNKQKHDSSSPFLIGGIEGVDRHLLIPEKQMIQGNLF
ncbi:DUF1848 domain-containing protein [Pectobacterium brasiliense]|uniref:DUF1848 domain-containing protein n=1 Tax=Pectobacterium brasiliense TaxID=180957 RepID=UPI002A8229F0|nr:DUF1848 domain-containing protein [Pectobacterium brasiliense]MDY4348880.1 DUF1848 domain-containing protein [Pectobacterium brasiliense]